MIINIGILAHVDAGKTTLTESLLYTSGVILEPGNVDRGTTVTDSMLLEKQRGITIQASVTSLEWQGVKVNIVDTPGHMDFLAEVQRSLAVLDGAVLVISAKDGVQAQTRILFHALRELGIPTLLFINKIDQDGIDLSAVYEGIREKLTPEIIIKQRVNLTALAVAPSDDLARWDNIIAGDDDLLTHFERGEALSEAQLQRCEGQRFKACTLFPIYHGSAKKMWGLLRSLTLSSSTFPPWFPTIRRFAEVSLRSNTPKRVGGWPIFDCTVADCTPGTASIGRAGARSSRSTRCAFPKKEKSCGVRWPSPAKLSSCLAYPCS